MHPQFIRQYYSKDGILDRIFEVCKEREVVPVFNDKYGKRPNIIQFKRDLDYLIKEGTTSFHGSVEHWKNPLQLSPDLRRKDLDNLRTGFDLVIDIDSDKGINHAKKAAILLIQAFKIHGVDNISVKFSGSRGFHVGIHRKTFPKIVNYEKVEYQFPELSQQIATYLKYFIRKKLKEQLLTLDSSLKKNINPYDIVHIEDNWSIRHLFRLPYSFNEKKWLISVPIETKKIASFDLKDAKPENVKADVGFLDKGDKNEAQDLVMEALDWNVEQSQKDTEKIKRDYKVPTKAISENQFCSCIKNILKGLKDGRKRSVFILIHFLRNVGWNWNEIEDLLKEWNDKNEEPLRESYIISQLNWSRKQSRTLLPPNHDNKGYYLDIGVYDKEICSRTKNPVNYTLRRIRGKK